MSVAAIPTPALAPTAQQYRIVPWFLTTIIVIHTLAVVAFLPGLFVWWGIPILIIGNFIFGSFGINLGYHRLLTHSSVKMPRWLERLSVLCGVCCLEGSPLWWVAIHRMHHQHSDAAEDPHSPQKSFFWGHMQWIFTANPQRDTLSTYEKYCPDLMSDKFLRWLHRKDRWVQIYLLHGLLIGVIGTIIAFLVHGFTNEALWLGAQIFLWAFAVRTVYVWHITWLVNSAAHRWGYQNYRTNDKSRNNWVVALLTNGEGWHNNHHAAPRAASHGHRWWEIDLTYSFLRGLKLIGLAQEIVPVKVPTYLLKTTHAEVLPQVEPVLPDVRDTAPPKS